MKRKLLFATLFVGITATASWQDMAKGVVDNLTSTKNTTQTTKTTQESSLVSKALKEALNQGVTVATNRLSQKNGFLNSSVKIPLPSSVQSVETAVRKVGGAEYADQLIQAMNSAATTSIPQTVAIFKTAISNMSIEDAQKILKGSNSATTEYFQSKTQESLTKAIAPIVKSSMEQNQVASYYKAFNNFYQTQGKALLKDSSITSYAKSFGVDSYLPGKDVNLDEYVTSKTIEGLFTYIAKEEKAIRTNPLSRTSDLLKEVFGG